MRRALSGGSWFAGSVVVLRDASLTDQRYPLQPRRFESSSPPRRLVVRLQIPARSLVPAKGALQRHAAVLEVQKRVASVEPAEELPDLVGNHFVEIPVQL